MIATECLLLCRFRHSFKLDCWDPNKYKVKKEGILNERRHDFQNGKYNK